MYVQRLSARVLNGRFSREGRDQFLTKTTITRTGDKNQALDTREGAWGTANLDLDSRDDGMNTPQSI